MAVAVVVAVVVAVAVAVAVAGCPVLYCTCVPVYLTSGTHAHASQVLESAAGTCKSNVHKAR